MKDLVYHMTNGKENAPENNEVENANEVDYFNSVIKARDRLIKLYEQYSRNYKKSQTDEDKALLDKCIGKLTRKEEEIEKFKEKGYLDPLDFPQSEGSDAE
jgi:hypothetical protein